MTEEEELNFLKQCNYDIVQTHNTINLTLGPRGELGDLNVKKDEAEKIQKLERIVDIRYQSKGGTPNLLIVIERKN